MRGLVIRWVLGLSGLLILASDLAQDLAFFEHSPSMRTAGLLGSMAVRNLLMLAAVGALFAGRSWAVYVLLPAAFFGILRRGIFLGGAAPALVARGVEDPGFVTFHSGFDLLWRVVVLALAVELVGNSRRAAE